MNNIIAFPSKVNVRDRLYSYMNDKLMNMLSEKDSTIRQMSESILSVMSQTIEADPEIEGSDLLAAIIGIFIIYLKSMETITIDPSIPANENPIYLFDVSMEIMSGLLK